MNNNENLIPTFDSFMNEHLDAQHAASFISLNEEEITKIETLLNKMLKGAEAKCALLVDKDGHLITRQGFTHSLDTTALAALLAGSFASTKEIGPACRSRNHR